MAAPKRQDEELEIPIPFKRVVGSETSPPLAIQRFIFTAVGTDIQVEAGYTDLADIREAVELFKQRKKIKPVPFYISARMLLQPSAVASFLNTAKKIEEHLKTQGVVIEHAEDVREGSTGGSGSGSD